MTVKADHWRAVLATCNPGEMVLPCEEPCTFVGGTVVGLSFDTTDRMRTLSGVSELAVSPMAVAAACLAWVFSRLARIDDEILVAIDDDESSLCGSALLRLPINDGCTMSGLAANAAKQLSAASEHPMLLAQIFAAGPESWRGVRRPVALAISPLSTPLHRQPPLEPALLLLLPAKGGGATLRSRCIASETVSRFAHRIGLCAAIPPGRPLVEAPLMDAAEASFVSVGCNRTAADWGSHHSLHAAFRAAALANPKTIALRAASQGHGSQEERALTYAELDGRSDALCTALLLLARHTLTRERRLVGVIFERSAALVVAVIGTLKSGAGYLPIEPSYPVTRISVTLAEAMPAAVLVGDAVDYPDVSSDTPVGRFLAGDGTPLEMPSLTGTLPLMPLAAFADDPLYVMYTSGSTGRPKGVIVTHGPLLKRISWMRHAFAIGPGDVVPFKTQVVTCPHRHASTSPASVRIALRAILCISVCVRYGASQFVFGVSEWELFHTLTTGATLLICDGDLLRKPAALAVAVAPCAVLFLVPSHLNMLLPSLRGVTRDLGLRHVVCCGEALLPRTVESFYATVAATARPPQLHNVYGPTEASMTHQTCLRGTPEVLIGEPIHNTTIWLLDSTQRLAPIGVPGEVYFGGIVAAGYLMQPELTAARFLSNPLLKATSSCGLQLSELGLPCLSGCGRHAAVPASPTVFRTGDLAVRLPSGALRYVGRIDRQVKVRGFRVELSEVESAARTFWERPIELAAVVFEGELCLYVCCLLTEETHLGRLRAHCASTLPTFMVPSRIIGLSSFPKLASGKTDMRALERGGAAPTAGALPDSILFGGRPAQSYAQVESLVLRVVCELAGATLASLMAETPLVDAGVDSLTATGLSSRLRSLTGVALSPTLVFEQPTPRAIAAHLLEQACPSPATFTPTDRTRPVGAALTLHGMLGRWPGGCGGEVPRWTMQAACGDAVGSVPWTRWTLEEANEAGVLCSMQVACMQHGGFILGAACFDAHAFAISTVEAATMDPQQRMLLELGYASLNSASHRRTTLTGSDGGVFLGIERPDWALVQPPAARVSVHAVTSDNVSVAAGRLPFVLGLQGPCSSIDTACSSAFAAVHSGAHVVQGGESACALVLAVSLKLAPHSTLGAASAGMLSVDGRCKTLDARANGYARSEGIGTFLLRCSGGMAPLILCGSTVRHDGRSASLTAPNGWAQRTLLLSALGRASVSVLEVGAVEVHGTGTALGDPTEVGALVAVHASREVGTRPVMLGGAKASVGHGETASGQVGLLRASREVTSSTESGNAQLRSLNPLVRERVGSVSTCLPVQRQPASSVLMRGVSSFGYSGTIAHAVASSGGDAFATLSTAEHGPTVLLTYRRSAFPWRAPAHPFAQRRLPSSGSTCAICRSRAAGVLSSLVANHVVQGRTIWDLPRRGLP